jgi:hypothetical protein
MANLDIHPARSQGRVREATVIDKKGRWSRKPPASKVCWFQLAIGLTTAARLTATGFALAASATLAITLGIIGLFPWLLPSRVDPGSPETN